MARLESTAVGGYYPAPERLIPWVARLLQVAENPEGDTYAVLDPCAGEGAAMLSCCKALFGEDLRHTGARLRFFAIEMEHTRYENLTQECSAVLPWGACTSGSISTLLHGDAFRVTWKPNGRSDGVGLLWLNPPYDVDREYKRTEERFLLRFTQALAPQGVLVFLVPFYALTASAATLSKHYANIRCYRLPEPEFSGFRQVFVLATRRDVDLWEPDPQQVVTIQQWASDADSIPVLGPNHTPQYRVPTTEDYNGGLPGWQVTQVDLHKVLSELKPWGFSARGVGIQQAPGIIPDMSVDDLLIRRFPVAMPPRSAHIAAGIAAGVFNGARIEPDAEGSKLPPILVKGVFNKEFRQVEEKTNKDNDVIGVVEVQQPRLITTVLDLNTHKYHTITPSGVRTEATALSEMTMADLLAAYGKGLMRVMLDQCPVMHDPTNPEHAIPLAPIKRRLYEAQSHATQATVKLLGGLEAKSRWGKAAFVLGEIGSGKSSVALSTAITIGSKRMLVLCPPHLLDSWKEQVQAVLGDTRVEVLADIGDVRRLAADKDPQMVVSLLSRETAKLGHSWAGVGAVCPRCGAHVPSDVDHVKRHSRCDSQRRTPLNDTARLVQEMALTLLPVAPQDAGLLQVLPGRNLTRYARICAERLLTAPENRSALWANTRRNKISALLLRLRDLCVLHQDEPDLLEAFWLLAMACPDAETIEECARTIYMGNLAPTQYSETGRAQREAALLFLFLLPRGKRNQIANELRANTPIHANCHSYYTTSDIWSNWDKKVTALDEAAPKASPYNDPWSELYRTSDGLLRYGKDPGTVVQGTPECALRALYKLIKESKFRLSRPCGEFLFQAVPEPRRYPVARYISKHYPRLFDMLVLDEGHEYSSENSAQQKAAHRLTNLGLPTLLMTGTIMNGYAASLFTNMWALSPLFREEFNREDSSSFVDRYGYRKRLVQDRSEGKVVEYGSMTDRVERSETVIGNAPGVLPLFVLKHLLPLSVTLHKTDLAVEIPDCAIHVVPVPPTEELTKRYERLQKALVKQIRDDRCNPELAGKLWGAMAELPSYFDRATSDTGNSEDGFYRIVYPESVGGQCITMQTPIDASETLPKEAWMVDTIERELAEGRNVLVFAWHTVLLPRLARLLEKHFDCKVPILNPDKVSTTKRQAWIDKEIVKKGRRILVVNPVAIQTGLNNLVHFSTVIWMQNPACNPITYRQAIGRIDRIGQENSTRVFFPVYQNTTQETLHSLLLHKVAVSMSTDGLDAESALQAAGVLDQDAFSGFAVGRQLYDLLVNASQMPSRNRYDLLRQELVA